MYLSDPIAFPSTNLLHLHRMTVETEAEEKVAQLFHQFQRQFIDALEAQTTQLKEAYQKAYAEVDEYGVNQSGTSLSLQAQSTNYERITQLVAYCGPNPGRVTLGDRQIIIPAATIQSLGGLWRLAHTDIRRIESVILTAGAVSATGAAGLLYLELFGTEIPTGSIMW